MTGGSDGWSFRKFRGSVTRSAEVLEEVVGGVSGSSEEVSPRIAE